ncbi:MAG: HAD-IA family hydrolase [Candidatus Taylorbacteria bacterium]
MIKAIIFDLNGIFIQGEKLSARFERDFGIPVREFLPELVLIMSKMRLPNAGKAFDYWKPVLDGWNIKLSESEFFKYWFDGERVSEEMITLARELKGKGILLIILSNNFKERSVYYRQYPWMSNIFHAVYFSWKTGLVKPDAKVWRRALEENRLNSNECLYFDDQEKNVKTAESLGIVSFLFIDSEHTRDSINKYVPNF